MDTIREWYDSLTRKSKETVGVSPSVIAAPFVGSYVAYKATTMYRNFQKAKGPMMYAGIAGAVFALGSLGVAYVREQHIPEKVMTKTEQLKESLSVHKDDLKRDYVVAREKLAVTGGVIINTVASKRDEATEKIAHAKETLGERFQQVREKVVDRAHTAQTQVSEGAHQLMDKVQEKRAEIYDRINK